MSDENKAVLDLMSELLASGLKTEVEPFPETEREVDEILLRLKALDPNDIRGKLVISGFLDQPYGPEKMRCLECMYYLANRQWCDLPELSVPAKPNWYCRLWRI